MKKMNKRISCLLLSVCVMFGAAAGLMGQPAMSAAAGADLIGSGDFRHRTADERVHVHNHAYLPEEWFFTSQTDQEIRERVLQMKEYAIEYQFANIGTLRDDGALDETQSSELGHWMKVSRETDPDQKVIAWINGDTVKHLHAGQEMQATIVSSLKTMIEAGFTYEGSVYYVDGIQFDIEPLRATWKDDEQLLVLLRAIRQAAGSELHLSIAGPAWDVVWSNDYITQLAEIVDMINPMIYDLNGPDSWKPHVVQSGAEYEAAWKDTVRRYSQAIAASGNPSCQLAPIMPAYDTKSIMETNPDAPEFGQFIVYHDPYIENVYHAARGLKQAMAEGAAVYGSGIFWWGTFILPEPDARDNQDYADAREWWMTEWVHNEESSRLPRPLGPPAKPEEGRLVNGSFESGTQGWEDWGNVTIVTDAAPEGGQKAARIGVDEGGMGQIISGIKAGVKYTLSGWGKVDHPNDEVIIGIDSLNDHPGGGGANKIPGGKFTITFSGMDYAHKAIEFVTIPDTTKLQIYVYKESAGGGYGYVDGIELN